METYQRISFEAAKALLEKGFTLRAKNQAKDVAYKNHKGNFVIKGKDDQGESPLDAIHFQRTKWTTDSPR